MARHNDTQCWNVLADGFGRCVNAAFTQQKIWQCIDATGKEFPVGQVGLVAKSVCVALRACANTSACAKKTLGLAVDFVKAAFCEERVKTEKLRERGEEDTQ